MILTLLLALLPGLLASQEDEAEARVTVQMLPDARPNPDGSPTRVAVAVFVVDIVKVDNVSQSFLTNFFIAARWEDPRLADPDAELVRTMPIDEVWNPRLAVINKRRLFKDFPEVVRVTPDGTVSYVQRFYGELSSPADLREFPFDVRSFEFRLATLGSSPAEVELVTDSRTGHAAELSVADWRTTGEEVRVGTFEAPSLPMPLSSMTYTVDAKRRSRFYLFKAIVPLTMIVLMSMAVFWISPTYVPPQIAVASTSVLTLIAYQFSTALILPRVPYLTRMDEFAMLSSALVFVALTEAILTGFLGSKRPDVILRIDRVGRVLFPVAFGAILFYSFG